MILKRRYKIYPVTKADCLSLLGFWIRKLQDQEPAVGILTLRPGINSEETQLALIGEGNALLDSRKVVRPGQTPSGIGQSALGLKSQFPAHSHSLPGGSAFVLVT